MSSGTTSALGTLTSVAQAGQKPAEPAFVDRIKMAGDGDYAAGGTSGLLAALRTLRDDGRTILGAVCVTQRGLSGTTESAASAKTYDFLYDAATDKIQAFNTTSGAEASAGANLSTTMTEWLVWSY